MNKVEEYKSKINYDVWDDVTTIPATNMIELSTYRGSDNYKDRKAKVLWCTKSKSYFVDLCMDGRSEIRSMGYHSERYAEDCAENFVMGYGEFSGHI